MSNTPKKRAKPRPDVDTAPPAKDLPRVPRPDELTFDDMWLVKAATGIDVLDPPIRGMAVAACLWFVCRDLPRPLTWAEAKSYTLDDVEIGPTDLDKALPRDEHGEPDPEAAADPTSGSETPSSA